MEDAHYSINIRDLSMVEQILFPDTFDQYSKTVEYLFRPKNIYILEDDILEAFKDDPNIKKEWERGHIRMGPIKAAFPNRFVREDIHPKEGGAEDEGVWGWIDLWSDYSLTPQEPLFSLFFSYKVRQIDLMELDNLLNYHLEHSFNDDKKKFIRFLTLTMRTHKELLQPEHIETMNEWVAEQEKQTELSGTEIRPKIKRTRDDKVTLLNQEQTALLAYCLRETKIILNDEFLNNKETGQAFSILTGYSADTIRQNLKKTELVNTANIKNIEAVEKALKEIMKYIEKQIKPE